jgi:photosynthetic reaction center cytochrome c subunit
MAKGTLVVIGLAGLLLWASRSSNAQSAQAPVNTAGKTAVQAYKNIMILKDIPADQLIPSMQFISASLGVECEFCHVEHAFEKDDKKEKQTAREMLTMMFAINKENFKGRREVTCNSCHHGSAQVAAVPAIAEEANTFEHALGQPATANASASGENPQSGPAKPSADQVIDKYLQAVGGTDALGKIDTLVEHGHISFGGRQAPVDVYVKAPDKRLSVMHMPNGDSITAFDGQAGWLANGGRAPRSMNNAENAGAKIDAELSFPTNLKQMFDESRVGRPEKIGEQDETVVVGRKKGQAPVKLYFDPQSGLLTRVLRYTETPLGRLPVQIDYSNYRDVGGVKLPEQWTLARPGGRFTIQIDQVDRRPIPDSRFAQPAVAPASGGGKN